MQQTVIVALCAVGMTMIIVHGGIDLSVGSNVAFTAVVIATLLKSGHGPFVSALGGILAATSAGAVTGALVTRFDIPPFIVTLGGMSILRGAAKGIAHEQKIDCDTRGLETLLAPPSHGFLLFAPGVFVAVGVAIVFALVLRYTRFGRHVFAVGSNEQAARLAGIDTKRLKILVYTVAGVLVGLAGLMELSDLTVGDPTTADGLELDVIAAVVIGGASLSGGEGSIAGSMVGALLMSVIKNGCLAVGYPNWVQEIVTGAIILVASGIDRLRHRRA
jgi:ribose transport system permease protein